jgi:hypothetical protein
MKKTVLTYTLLMLGVIANAQSPWTREKGKFFTQIGASVLIYDQINLDGKTLESGNDYYDYTFQSYTEFGVSDKVEIQAIIPMKTLGYEAKTGGNKQSQSGLGNAVLGGKYKFFDKNWKISAGISVSLNTISKNDTKGLRTGFDATTIQPYITAGSSNGKLYYFGNLGYGYMTNDYSSFARIGGEIGYEVIKRGHLIFAVDAKQPLQDDSKFAKEEQPTYLGTATYLDRQTYTAFGLKGNYEIKQDAFGVNFSVFGAAGLENIAATPSLNLGTYFKF